MNSGILEIDSGMTEGQTNDFLRDIYMLQKRQKSGVNDRKKEKKGNEGDGEEKDVNEKEDKDAKKMAAEFEGLCDEDKILVFFKRLLNVWGKKLEEMPEMEKRTAAGKSMFSAKEHQKFQSSYATILKSHMTALKKRTRKEKRAHANSSAE